MAAGENPVHAVEVPVICGLYAFSEEIQEGFQKKEERKGASEEAPNVMLLF